MISKILGMMNTLKKNIDGGMLGFQTGEGYYDYPGQSFQFVDFVSISDISN
jgi:hypothetical protein